MNWAVKSLASETVAISKASTLFVGNMHITSQISSNYLKKFFSCLHLLQRSFFLQLRNAIRENSDLQRHPNISIVIQTKDAMAHSCTIQPTVSLNDILFICHQERNGFPTKPSIPPFKPDNWFFVCLTPGILTSPLLKVLYNKVFEPEVRDEIVKNPFMCIMRHLYFRIRLLFTYQNIATHAN